MQISLPYAVYNPGLHRDVLLWQERPVIYTYTPKDLDMGEFVVTRDGGGKVVCSCVETRFKVGILSQTTRHEQKRHIRNFLKCVGKEGMQKARERARKLYRTFTEDDTTIPVFIRTKD